MRPSTPTFITMLPSTVEHSRARRTKLAWYFRVIAVLSPVGPTVRVAAPRRTSTAGQLRSAGTPGAVCATLRDEELEELFTGTEPAVSCCASGVAALGALVAAQLANSANQNAGAKSAQPYLSSRLPAPGMTPPLVQDVPDGFLYQGNRGHPKAANGAWLRRRGGKANGRKLKRRQAFLETPPVTCASPLTLRILQAPVEQMILPDAVDAEIFARIALAHEAGFSRSRIEAVLVGMQAASSRCSRSVPNANGITARTAAVM